MPFDPAKVLLIGFAILIKILLVYCEVLLDHVDYTEGQHIAIALALVHADFIDNEKGHIL